MKRRLDKINYVTVQNQNIVSDKIKIGTKVIIKSYVKLLTTESLRRKTQTNLTFQ